MPRKANGFGTQNVSFKSFSTANKKGTSAAGFYPSDRKFGSTVHRSVIEKWDIDSKWAKWRKGTTIYSYTYWSKLMTKNLSYDPGSARGGTNVPYVPSSIASSLFTGASYSYDLKFSGYEFPTMNSDVIAPCGIWTCGHLLRRQQRYATDKIRGYSFYNPFRNNI